MGADGNVFFGGESTLLLFFALALLANFYLLYRGVSKGIEWFSKVSMPILLITAIVVLVRVLTMGTPDPSHPERNVNEGLGYMWNPDKVLLVNAAEDPATGKKGTVLDMVPATATEAEQTAQVVNMPCILCNGSYLFDTETDEILNPHYLNPIPLIEAFKEMTSCFI